MDEQSGISGYMRRTPREIRQHCTQKHGWVNQQKRGGDAYLRQVHVVNSIWTSNHACQRFFKEGGWQKYFEVSRRVQTSNPDGQDNARQTFFRSQKTDIAQAEQDAKMPIESEASTAIDRLSYPS